MLTPLYPIANLPATITVVAPGALAGDSSVPVAPLTIALPAGYLLDFGNPKYAKLADDAAVDDETLTTEPLPTALDPADEATIAGSSSVALLGEQWTKLGGRDLTSDERAALQLAYQINAELILDLRAGYTGDDAEQLAYAVVLQLAFMLEHGLTPSLIKATSQGGPSAATRTYRDRWIDPNAAAIVARVTGRRQVRFEPFMAGV